VKSVGTKFGNVHVKTNNVDEVVLALKELLSENTIDPVKSSGNLSGFESLIYQANLTRKIFYVGNVEKGWVSILNDWFGWGEVEAFGEALSSYLSSPILTCSYFDDDLLEINLYKNGGQLTGQLWCSDYVQDDYGLESKEADVSILTELLGHTYIGKIIQALNNDDREQVIQEFESILRIPLWIHSEWFNVMNDDEIKNKYTKYDLNT
jgi:hypothetical protein